MGRLLHVTHMWLLVLLLAIGRNVLLLALVIRMVIWLRLMVVVM